MRNAHGYGRVFCENPDTAVAEVNGGKTKLVGAEHDTFRCGHCQHIVYVAPKERPEDIGGMCYVCMRLVCSQCVITGKCDPLEEKVNRVEKTQDWRRWYLDACK